MSYVEDVIGSDESVTYAAQVHWIVLVRALVWFMAAVVIYIGIQFLPVELDRYSGVVRLLVQSIWFGPFVIGLIDLLAGLIRIKTTELVITTKRVIAKRGFITRHSVELLLTRTETVEVHQTIMGRVLDYGTIRISGVGGATAPIACISDPLSFRAAVSNSVESSARR